MKIPYFQFYARDWLEDTHVIRLTLEEKGAYIHLLAASWATSDTCTFPNDDLLISRRLNISINKWRKLRKVLIEGEFPVFCIENERLCNRRLLQEFALFKEKSEKNSKKVKQFWEDKKKQQGVNSSKPLKNNNTQNTTVLPQNSHSDTITDTDTDTEDIKKKYIKKEKIIKPKNRTEVPEDFQPNEKHIALAQELKLDLEDQRQRFIAHYRGHGTLMLRWDQIFTNWLKRTAEWAKQQRGNNYAKPLTAVQNFQRLIDEGRQREEADKS